MLSRRGAKVLHGPTMSTTLLGDVDATIAATQTVIDDGADIVVLTTGIGVRSWFAAAESAGLDDPLRAALSGSVVIARGPKAEQAAMAVGLDVSWRAASETSVEIGDRLAADGVTGRARGLRAARRWCAAARRAARRSRRREGGGRPDLPLDAPGRSEPGSTPARCRQPPAGRRRDVHLPVRRAQRLRARRRRSRSRRCPGRGRPRRRRRPRDGGRPARPRGRRGWSSRRGAGSARWSGRSAACSPIGARCSLSTATTSAGRATRWPSTTAGTSS